MPKQRWVKGHPEPYLFPDSMDDQDITRVMFKNFGGELKKEIEYKKMMGKPSAGKAALIGAGKLSSDMVEGVKNLSYKLTGNDKALEDQRVRQEGNKTAYDYLKRQRPDATAAGEILPYFAVPTGLGAKGASSVVSKIPAMSKFANPLKNSIVADSAITGGLLGAADYNSDALSGAFGGTLGSSAGKLATSLLKPVDSVLTGVQGVNASKGKDIGYKLTPSMRTGSKPLRIVESSLESNPLTAGNMNKIADKNQANSNRIVAESLGFKGKDQITPQMLDEVSTRFNKRFNEVIKGNAVALDDKFLHDLAELESNNVDYWVKNKDITDIIDAALDDIEKGYISAEKYQTLSSKLVKTAKAAFRGANSNPEYGFAVSQIKDALDDAAERSLGKANRGKFQSVRKDYKNYIQLMKNGVINEDTGNVSLKQLGNILRREDKRGFRHGQNQSDLYNATRFERSFPDAFGNSGTTQRQQMQNILGQSIAAGSMGLLYGDGINEGLGAAAAVPAAMYGLGKIYNSKAGGKYLTNGLLPVLSKDIKNLITRNTGLLGMGLANE